MSDIKPVKEGNIIAGLIKNKNDNKIIYIELSPFSFETLKNDIKQGKFQITELPYPLYDIKLLHSNVDNNILLLTYKNDEYMGLTHDAYKKLIDSKIDLLEYFKI